MLRRGVWAAVLCWCWCGIAFARWEIALLLPGQASTPQRSERNEPRGPERTPAPLPPEEAVTAMRLPDGFRATLFAAEPQVVQPVSFCIDERGRLLVAEALNYGEWQPTGRDRIVILEDSDGDGRADSRKVFYEGLNYVTGIEVGFGGVWVMSPPSLYFLPDRNRDDQPDGPPEVLWDGFGYRESRHNLANGFTWGPDGWLYAGHGRTSPSEVGRPGTPAAERVHCDGGVIRLHPVQGRFENFADGTTNPWGVDFDDYGQCFVSNCVNPHLFHVIQGAHYEPWRNRPSSLYAYDRIATIADHLHYPSNQPQAMRGETAETLAMGGGHAHCGTLVYLGDSLPARYRNTVLMCNVHGRRVNHDVLRRQGSGYVASHAPDWMIAGDPWFMGVTLRTGPDGSVWVSDWSDTGECHTYKPERGTGRIFKISYGPSRTGTIDLTQQSQVELAELQLHANDWHVRQARRLLQERTATAPLEPAARTRLEQILDGQQLMTPQRLRGLWALEATRSLTPERLTSLLSDRDAELRAWAVRLWCDRLASGVGAADRAAVLQQFAALATNDSSPVVRLQLAVALQRVAETERLAIVRGLLSHGTDAQDHNLPLMIWYGLEPVVAREPVDALAIVVAGQFPRLREFAARRVVDQALARRARDDSAALPELDALVAALASAPDAALRDLLAGAREGMRGHRRIPLPRAWSALYQQLSQHTDQDVRRDATAMAVTLGDPVALAYFRRVVQEETQPIEQRRLALESLVATDSPEFAPLLQKLLATAELRLDALRGLAAIPHVDTPRLILARYDQLTAVEKEAAIAVLAARRSYAEVLLTSLEQQRIPRRDVSAFIVRQLSALGDSAWQQRLRTAWGDIRETSRSRQELIARYQAELTADVLATANPARGRQIFSRTCQNCHRLFGEGNSIGPDLTGANRSNLEYLLGNLLDPSAEISRDYRLSVVETTSGRLVTGIVVENSPSRVTIQTATERVTLTREDIESQRELRTSMMPEGQLDVLAADEVRDLIAYLGSPRQVPLPAEKERIQSR